MTDLTKAKIKDGVFAGLVYFVFGIAFDWHAGFSLHDVGWKVSSSIFFGLIFGTFFRPTFGAASRYHAYHKRGK